MIIITNSPFQTKKIGKNFSKKIKDRKNKKAVVLGLVGDLGGGKTTFLQGLAKGLGIKEKVLSPTFIIMRKYALESRKWPIARGLGPIGKVESGKKATLCPPLSTFYHFDCYRIQKPKEILDLGFKEIISDPKNIVVIEWAEKIKKILPKDTIWINFEFKDKNKRKIRIPKN